MRTLADKIREEAEPLLGDRDWELMSSRLTTNQNGKYQFNSLTDDGIQSIVFSEGIQNQIDDATSALQETRSVDEFEVTDSGATWVAGEGTVYAFETVSYTWDATEEEFKNVAQRVTKKYDDISPERVKTIDLSFSPLGVGFADGTVVYETTSPHETIANVDTFDEYIEWRADRNEDETEESLRSQQYYDDHFHPTNDSEIISLCEDMATHVTENITVHPPSSVTPSGIVMERDGEATVTVLVHAPIEELLQN